MDFNAHFPLRLMKKGAFLKSHGIQTLQSETAKRMFLDSNSPQINTDKHECFSEKLAQIAKNPFYLRLSVVKKVNFKTLSKGAKYAKLLILLAVLAGLALQNSRWNYFIKALSDWESPVSRALRN